MEIPKFKSLDLIVIAIAVLFLGGIGFAWYYYEQQNTNLVSKIGTQKHDLEEARKKIKLFEEFKKNSAALIAEKERLSSFIPNEEGQDRFIYELERLAQKCKLEVKSCILDKNPKKYKEFPQYVIYQWLVVFEGSYQDLLAFIDELPNANRFSAIF